MPEAGGTATQAGIFYQNSVAAMALAELLDLDPRIPRERATEVRLEAPEDVDDIVIRFADEHRRFQNVKLSIRVGSSAWSGIWRSLSAQHGSTMFSSHDQLTLVVEKRSSDSEAVAALCERAESSIDEQELRARLTGPQVSALESIVSILGSSTAAYELLRRTSVLHLSLTEIERELGRRRLAGGQSPPPTLLRSLALRPACSLSRPWRPFSSKCFRRRRYLLRPLRLLPAGATVAGRDSHPLRNSALARRTLKMG